MFTLPMFKSTFSADFANLDSIRDFVGDAAERAGFSGKEMYSIKLAADEACSNIIEHAYAGIPDGEIEIACDVENGQITIVIHDHGKEFDMSKVRQPNFSKNLSEREVGGLGVFLIHKLMDEVHFSSSKKTGNTLTMIKRKSGAT
jgi:serine/threonine-protein kinase RsbW